MNKLNRASTKVLRNPWYLHNQSFLLDFLQYNSEMLDDFLSFWYTVLKLFKFLVYYSQNYKFLIYWSQIYKLNPLIINIFIINQYVHVLVLIFKCIKITPSLLSDQKSQELHKITWSTTHAFLAIPGNL